MQWISLSTIYYTTLTEVTYLAISFVDVLISLLVHDHVITRALQQLLLRLPPAGHRHGCQDSAHHPVLGHTQRQTGRS